MDFTVCVFCGATGATVKITREHTFPTWINEVLTPDIVGPDLSYERTIRHGPQAGTSNVWPVKQVASHKVRAVCDPCNKGWMSNLEDQVKDVLEPMILGYNASLTRDQQITAATWASLKAAVFEYAWGSQPVLTSADRTVIMTQNRPPASVQVRLAAVESQGRPLQAIARGYVEAGSHEVTHCLTLSIGCLVVQVFGGPGAGSHGLRVVGGKVMDHVWIYPPNMDTVHWPPPNAFDDTTLQDFADPLGGLRQTHRPMSV